MIIGTGRCALTNFKEYRQILENQANRGMQIENPGRGQVRQARQLRRAGRAANNAFLRAGLLVPTFGNNIRLPAGGVNYVPEGFCRGEVHGDIVCGEPLTDALYCQWCYQYDHVHRFLCVRCRRTDSPGGQAHCREPCPAKQRIQGGRKPRSQHPPFTRGSGWGGSKRKWMSGTEMLMKQRYVRGRCGSLLTPEAQERVDKATALAAVGRLRAGGTAIGLSSPPETKLVRALRQFQVEHIAP